MTEKFDEELKFPWNYYYRLSRFNILYWGLFLVLTLISLKNRVHSMEDLNRIFFPHLFNFLFIAIVLYLIILWVSINLSRPLLVIFTKIERMMKDSSISKKLSFFYSNNDWKKIEVAFNESEELIKQQHEKLQQEHKKNQLILKAIKGPILIVDERFHVHFCNADACCLFKLNNESIKEEVFYRLTKEPIIEAIENNLVTEQLDIKVEGDLSDKFFNITVSPFQIDDNIKGALLFFHDLTQFKLTEKMRVDFIANISHEMRTPLTSIKGFSQMLGSQIEDEALSKLINKIEGNSDRLLVLFHDLMNLAKIQSTSEIEKSVINIKNIVEKISSNIKVIFDDKNFEISYNDDHEILGDKSLIEQVFTNLLTNSLKYSDTSDVKIKIHSEIEGDNLIIDCIDNGIGIPENKLSRIFERFYRVDKSRSNQPGSGLGLSITKHIILKHGGTISALKCESGTHIRIKIPHHN